jgi:putative addiction module component (TIGR02574 family)
LTVLVHALESSGSATEDIFMARALADIEEDIRALSERERVELLRKLIDGLDAPGDAGSEAAWHAESERRLGEIEGGSARTFPADEVLKEARTLLK